MQVDVFNKGLRDCAGLSHAGNSNDKRDAGAFFKERDFPPHEVFSQVVTVIRGEDDYGFIPEALLPECAEKQSQLGVDEGYARVIGLNVFSAQGIVLFSQFEPEGLKPFDHGQSRDVVPVVGWAEWKLQALPWITIKILLRSEEGDMRLLDTTCDEKWFFPVALVVQPLDDLLNVLSVLMLIVRQLCGTVTGLGLSTGLGGEGLQVGFPFLAVLPILDRTILLLKTDAGLSYQGKLVVLEHDLFVPGDLPVLMPR